ncbi:hypothetical protein CLV46_0095 [Diaminobutyricimonas aerilata]|uniref:3-methyladenine DNA glycosylase/8-oxoguanine DNA glycosylase n=1 Tax=Diaminobutyricimonas aerilata TaxID=1162967 RepID=A0A2M9CF94_9MICO|nr:DNA-3-methyladenine glycosylase [Diaminobutyricimonas aerilata]PJJ70573.1 hypothetical protein CLV46_0095 [Diaminobutyricimonas aerilata]
MIPVQTVYAPRDPVALRPTLSPLQRGAADPTLRWDAAGAWMTMRTPHGIATLHLAGTREITARAWGPGAEWAIDGVPELLGEGDDWSELDLSGNPFLAEVRRTNPHLRLSRTRRVFEALVPAVLEQKITTLEARRAWRYLLAKYGETPPGPAPLGMKVFPAPEVWRRIPSWEWHRAGVGPQRSETAVRCASVAASLERTLEHGRGGEQVARALTSLRGVGVWTAAETSQRAHGDPDAVSVGDYHLHDIVGWALIGEKVDDAGMMELLEPWRGHRQRVMRLILASGRMPPKHGARMTVQDHRWH